MELVQERVDPQGLSRREFDTALGALEKQVGGET